METEIPQKVKEILEKFENEGFEIYIVGGAVRDILMGKTVYDWDFTTNANPEKILTFFDEAYYTNEFGTVGVSSELPGERPYEITTFRTEYGYTDARRPDRVEWGKTLEEDLKRRDFTINAMALKKINDKKQDIKKTSTIKLLPFVFEIVDIYNGKDDLKNKLVCAVGDPNERFSEDALRMMRAIRIAAELKFKIEKSTLAAIKKNAPLINKISGERVRDELFKILKTPNPYEGIVFLRESGLMQELLPELERSFGVEQKSPGRHHIYNVGTHSLLSLKYVAERNSDPIVRLATLIHDIGKPKVYKKLDNGIITFYNHEVVSAIIAKNIAVRLRFSNKDKDRLYKLVRFHQFSVDEKQTDSAIRRFIKRVGKENISDMIDLRIGDRLGGGARETSWRLEGFIKRIEEVQKQPFTVHDLKITGFDIMKELEIEPGPKVGEILDKLYANVVNKKIENNKEDLLESLHKFK
jgi:tRNA nucleotidyltransferase (CCA-adding enzyme)